MPLVTALVTSVFGRESIEASKEHWWPRLPPVAQHPEILHGVAIQGKIPSGDVNPGRRFVARATSLCRWAGLLLPFRQKECCRCRVSIMYRRLLVVGR